MGMGYMGTYSMCICFPKKFWVTEAEPPMDVKEVFMEYAEGGAFMTVEQLRKFLVEVQGVDAEASMEDAERIVEEVLQKRHNNNNAINYTNQALSLEDFHFYLFSVDLNPFLLNQVEKKSVIFPLLFSWCFSLATYEINGRRNYISGSSRYDCSSFPLLHIYWSQFIFDWKPNQQ